MVISDQMAVLLDYEHEQNQCYCWAPDLFLEPYLNNEIVYKLTFDTIISLTLLITESENTHISLSVPIIFL